MRNRWWLSSEYVAGDMQVRRTLEAGAVAALVLLQGVSARAAEPTEAEVEMAREYFAQAQALGESGAWVDADDVPALGGLDRGSYSAFFIISINHWRK